MRAASRSSEFDLAVAARHSGRGPPRCVHRSSARRRCPSAISATGDRRRSAGCGRRGKLGLAGSASPCATETRSSNTKHSPCQRLSLGRHLFQIFQDAALEVEDVLDARASGQAVAFSQRMPPVQNIATFCALEFGAVAAATQAGKSRKLDVCGSIAPAKVPSATS